MRTLERGARRESFGNTVARVAYAYGFSAPPVTISRKAMSDMGGADAKTAAAMALMSGKDAPKGPSQTWGSAKTSRGTVLSFAVISARQAIAHAITVKTALSIAEEAGYTELSVLISSVGDAESRKRFTRELSNFFRKHAESLTPEVKQLAAHNPDAAYRAMLAANDPLLARAPRSIDYLSESSRRSMLSTLSLFESVGIPYAMHPRLAAEPGVHSEILFAIEGTDKRGEHTRIASGGRYDEYLKRERGKPEAAIGISIEVPDRVDVEEMEETPECFVVHVGDAAKLKAFSVLEALWRAHVAVGQALMSENLRDQMVLGTATKTRYIAIIGQREALDGTVIVRSVATQLQTVLPIEKLAGHVSRGHRG